MHVEYRVDDSSKKQTLGQTLPLPVCGSADIYSYMGETESYPVLKVQPHVTYGV
jgi:hypothetical protein